MVNHVKEAKAPSQSMSYACVNPSVTRHALYLTTNPSN